MRRAVFNTLRLRSSVAYLFPTMFTRFYDKRFINLAAIHAVSALRNYNVSVSGRLGCSIQKVIVETTNLYKRGKESPKNETAKNPSK